MSNIYRLTAIYKYYTKRFPEGGYRILDCKISGDTALVDVTINGKQKVEQFTFNGDELEV